MMFFKEIKPGTEIPRFYGLAFSREQYLKAYACPLGFNIIIYLLVELLRAFRRSTIDCATATHWPYGWRVFKTKHIKFRESEVTE